MSPRRPSFDRSLAIAIVLWAIVGSISLVLAGRALAGAFDEQVSGVIPFLATLFTLCGSLVAWTLFHRQGTRGDVGRRLLDGLLSLLPASVAGFAAAVNAGPATLASLTCLLVCGLCYVVVREGTRFEGLALSNSSLPEDQRVQDEPSAADSDTALTIATPTEATDPFSSEPDEHLSQQVTRRSQPDGSEQIEAVLVACFAPGERETAVHLPITPVLSALPHVETEPLDDAELSLQTTAVHRYGVRVAVRRSGPISEASDATVGILVTAQVAGQSAA